MVLNFNLSGVFFLTLLTALWQIFLPYPVFGVMGLLFFYLGKLHWRRQLFITDIFFAVGFTFYVLEINLFSGNTHQYDYFNFYMHADFFLRNQFFINNFAAFWSEAYYQPPLWGLLAALVTKAVSFAGYSYEEAYNYVRFINLFAISGAGVVFWRLMSDFHFPDKIKASLFAFFLFFPIHGIFANLVNNDALVYFFMLLIVRLTLQWAKDGTFKQAGLLSLLLFLAGMTKFSGLMCVSGIGGIGIYRLFLAKNKRSLQMWGQFALIGLGAFAGFIWGFVLLYFHLPLVPPPVYSGWQSLEQYTLAERLFSTKQFFMPYVDVANGVFEPNVWLALIKTSLFGEWSWALGYSSYILYILGIIWALIAVFSFFSLYFYKTDGKWYFNLFAVILTFTVLISWLQFWQFFPYFCSSEFRYVVILFPLSCMWFGNYLIHKKPPKAVFYALAGVLMIFIVAEITLVLNTM